MGHSESIDLSGQQHKYQKNPQLTETDRNRQKRTAMDRQKQERTEKNRNRQKQTEMDKNGL